MLSFYDDSIDGSLDRRTLLAIVVGSAPEEELTARALAYELRGSILDWQEADDEPSPLRPVVCTDLWYMNDEALRVQPVVTIGPPEANAATAYHASKLPGVFVMEGRYRVHLDPEFLKPHASLWGAGPRATADAVECFTERYLADWLEAAHSTHPRPSNGRSDG